jgi:nucleoside phosphorylase/tetratricopeptide (TPR) repeat protein
MRPPPPLVRAARAATSLRSCRRDAFQIAIICALSREYDALSLILDDLWEDGDGNGTLHRTGRIGKHNAVVALLSGMGKARAASTAAGIRSRYPNVRLVFLLGVCGGVPRSGNDEILLGDVVISNAVVQYDFGRQYPDKFEPKHGAEDSMARPDKDFRTLLATFQTADGRQHLQRRTADFLQQLQTAATNKNCKSTYEYPGLTEDKLFAPSYRHKHRGSPSCICRMCETASDPVCEEASNSPCDTLQCDELHLVPRERLRLRLETVKTTPEPAIHIGPVGSGDMTIKSGEHRDGIARPQRIIAFEMEGAGVAEEIPCVVIKGVCDYADCHKNKKWQDFAAAAAAATFKAVLEQYTHRAVESQDRLVEAVPLSAQFFVPFGRNRDFVGRQSTLDNLLERIPPCADKDDCQKTAIEGLGGVGKTQIALEAAFRVRDKHPDCHIFWVPAIDEATFENAYREIGRRLGVAGINDETADTKLLVRTALSETADDWLLIIDNADDAGLLFGAVRGTTALSDCLPFSSRGSILFTTRNHEAVIGLDIPQRGIVKLEEMSRPEATELFQRNLPAHQFSDTQSTASLLGFLANLPLAIKQASAYMAKTGMTTTQYLGHCMSGDERVIKLLSKEFEDRGRYKKARNPIAATWLISFDHISRDSPLAAQYLRFMSLLGEKDIPKCLLPPGGGELELDEAIGTLKSYAFVSERAGQDSYDMHRLVRLAMRNWLAEKGELKQCTTTTMQRVSEVYSHPKYENRTIWARYLPHALPLLGFEDEPDSYQAKMTLLFNVALSSEKLGKCRDAEGLYRQTLNIQTHVLGAEHIKTLKTKDRLGNALKLQGKYVEAKTILQQVVEIQTRVLGTNSRHTLYSTNRLAHVLCCLGEHEESEALHRHIFELQTQVLGMDHSHTVESLDNLAWAVFKSGKLQEAEALQRRTVELRTRARGQENPNTVRSLSKLTHILHMQGKYDEAETLYRQLLKLETQMLGADHPSTVRSVDNFVCLLRIQGRTEEVEAILQANNRL